MKVLESLNYRTAKELYEKLRSQKTRKPSLRVKLTLFVCFEIILCVLLALGFDALLGKTIFKDWEGTLYVELIVISGIVGSLITSYVSKYFFLPIKNLRNAMDKVAQGDFSVSIETKSNTPEIKEVYAGFNMMTQELNSTEILQTDFVSNVSHEFKTPINAIEGYSTLLQGCEGLTDEEKEYVEKILFNTKRLSTLLGNILLLSKIENQAIQTNKTVFSLDEQIRQSIVALENAWTAKNIEFDIELEDIQYSGSESLMNHVWSNLIGNAIKFSFDGGIIRIRLFKEKEKTVFTVEDNGIGLSEDAKNHIFDKFYQGDSSHKQEGNGLGLALVKRILTISGGDIFAENNPDGGCKFTVILK